MFDPANGI